MHRDAPEAVTRGQEEAAHPLSWCCPGTLPLPASHGGLGEEILLAVSNYLPGLTSCKVEADSFSAAWKVMPTEVMPTSQQKLSRFPTYPRPQELTGGRISSVRTR